MLQEILSSFSYMFGALFEYLMFIFDELGVFGMIVGAMTVYTIVRLLIIPLVGGNLNSGASDTVQKKSLTETNKKLSDKARKIK